MPSSSSPLLAVDKVQKEAPPSEQRTVKRVANEAVELKRQIRAKHKAGDLRAALTLARSALTKFPSDKHLISAAAALEGKVGSITAGLQLLYDGLAEEPSNLFFLNTAAVLEGKRRNFSAARRLYKIAHEQHPRSAPVLQVWLMESCLHISIRCC